MTRRVSLALLLSVALFGPALSTANPWLSGEVRAVEGEVIFTPPSNSSPVVLRYYVPEGTRVKPGDVLVRIDPGQSASQVLQLEAQIDQLRAQVAKDVAELEVKAADAELLLIDADAALAKAKIDAAIPRQHLSALDADRYAGELQRAEREAGLKQVEWEAAVEAVARRRGDAALELSKLEADLAYHRAEVATAEQRAERAGVVIHSFDSWRGQRFDEGSSAYPGNRIGDVVGDGPLGVRLWALEPDRVGLREQQAVELRFDAYPGVEARGRIERISGAPEPKAEWGEGRYFSIDVTLDAALEVDLLSGMSVRARALEDEA